MPQPNDPTLTPRPVSRWARAALCVAVALPLATLAACGKKADDPAAGAASAAMTPTPTPAPAVAPSADASMPDAGASSPAMPASDPMSAMPAASTASMP